MTDPSDPTPERPGMQDETAAHPGTPRESEAEETSGQVSEAGGLGGGAISDGDSVVGSPSGESGQTDRGAVGPDGVPPENRRDNDFKKPGPKHRRADESVDDA
ncbi:hypothetical protein [Nocardioides sp. CER19]|uniref:hypothetical protein n=1 Tax=Nocardioides sp. CER19 TaxID=3038538 RepID=UPI00244A3360|nr:hypothetical protein [Nocardioides sp. CER19]MDH2414935.1 hypothetical protein [Nocardioides sp. CER19]